jgi:hypothetical protein
MKILSLGKFGFAYCFVLLTGPDACFDGIIGQDIFFRFTAGDESKRAGA